MNARWFLLSLALAACTDAPPETPATPEVPAAPAAPPPELNLAALQQEASMDAMVPSPAEAQKALQNAGLSSSLYKMTEGRDLKVTVADKDEVAVRTGVMLAHIVLCAKEAPNERLQAQLAELKTGLQILGGSPRIIATVDDLSARIGNNAASRDDIVREMDELANVSVADADATLPERALPLLRAGAWLEGAWLVTAALQNEQKFDVATTLLRQPGVVSYFRDYLYGPGKEVAPAAISEQLKSTLTTLEGITSKETLGAEDVAAIHTATDGLLSKLRE